MTQLSLPGFSELSGWIRQGSVRIAEISSTRKSRQKAALERAAKMDGLFAEAKTRMRALTGIQEMNSLPVVFLMGDFHSEEPSNVFSSGIEPELLAGRQGAGIWYARQTVFVEASVASGGLAWDAAARRKLFKLFLPVQQLNSVLVSKNPPTRSAVVEVDCDLLLRADAADDRFRKAAHYRRILSELAQDLGFRVPVYVLFHRADRIAYFGDFAAKITGQDAEQVLGVSLPVSSSQRDAVNDAFQTMSHALAEQRTIPLARAQSAQALSNLYEFPREFGKLRPLVVQFLTDLCDVAATRPHPFLRGFYFAGLREPDKNQSSAFLERLFPDVVLADRVASAAAQGHMKVNSGLRITLAAVAFLSLLCALWAAISYRQNSDLVREAAMELRPAPSLESLQVLTRLEATLSTLSGYERNGEPLRYGALLYRGGEVRMPLRRKYYALFRRLLLQPAQQSLVAVCKSAPAYGRAPYEDVYDALKAYLITTMFHERSSADFLSTRLTRHWLQQTSADPKRESLVRKNFEFYAKELAAEDPFPDLNALDSLAISGARAYLNGFAMGERLSHEMGSAGSWDTRPLDMEARNEAWVLGGKE